jgi:hypothetical protein
MNQKSTNNKPQKNLRPPSANLKKDKKPKASLQNNPEISSKAKASEKISTTPIKTEKSSVKDNSKRSKKEKSIKINASSNMDEKEDVSLIDLIQEKGNSIIESKNDNINNYNNYKNINQSFKKNENYNAKINFNYASEIKITPYITTINKLINSSQEALKEQTNILDNLNELNKRFVSSELEFQKQTNKAENDDFNNFTDKYLGILNEVIERLKCHSEEMENIKSKYTL